MRFRCKPKKERLLTTDRRYILLLACIALLTACVNDDYPEWCDAPVKASLAFSVSNATTPLTRATDGVVQEGSGTFRGIQDLMIIPFDVTGDITSADRPKLISSTGEMTFYEPTNARYYYYDNCSFMQGVASFLVYGRATTATGGKAVNGSLVANFPIDMMPANITFSLEPIRNTTDIHADAQAIADYLTAIANTDGWATTTDSRLRAYYQNFIGQGSVAPSVIAGSSASVKAYVTALNTLITAEPESTLRTAILSSIDITNINSRIPAGYPSSLGLPEGAAALRWEIPAGGSAYAFVPQTVTTTEASINSVTRYAYPPELYYYDNSQIRTSTIDDRKASYSASRTWETVLNDYEYDNGIVSNNTRSIAIKKPVQYAVARMDAYFQASGTTLKDAKDANVDIGGIQLTGVLVGGQRPVGFDFRPTDNSDVNMRFVYDSQVNTNSGGTSYPLSIAEQGPVRTLLLQDYDGQNETVMLEFVNNSQDFTGVDGIIHKGTKFYLVGTITAPTPGAEDYTKRVFTQDYTTTVHLKVESLAHAYHVVPDLLSPRLEVGVRLTMDWEQTTPTVVPLS